MNESSVTATVAMADTAIAASAVCRTPVCFISRSLRLRAAGERQLLPCLGLGKGGGRSRLRRQPCRDGRDIAAAQPGGDFRHAIRLGRVPDSFLPRAELSVD